MEWTELEKGTAQYQMKISTFQWNTYAPKHQYISDFQTAFFGLSELSNPIKYSTSLSYTLHKTGEINLSLYDLTGSLVQTLIQGKYEAGKHSIMFNGENLPPSIYFARLQTSDGFSDTKKMILLK